MRNSSNVLSQLRLVAARVLAGKIIHVIAPIVGGKPDNTRGGGKDASKLDEALAKVKMLLG